MGNSNGKPVVFTDDVNLNHFRLLRVVGKGAFGKVRIVERKDTGLTFALKYIRKDEIVRSESVRNIIRERRMLEHLNHPFICNLRYSFQDIEYMYIVVDLMNGGDLRFHISRKTFTEDAVRFWIAELGCALRYIHKQGIIHRDVKPDNVLLDSEGHVHLADFNVASDFVPGKQLTSKSGTLAYLAPEVYKGTGYSCGADWWSLGALFYECIYNKRPFEGSTQTQLSAQIIAANPKYHVTQPPVSNSCLHAISSALESDPSKRMGSAGFCTFTDNPFFRPIDFEALERKEIEPVFVPSSDKTNFDATYDLEELLLEEAPLEARARRQKPREQLKDDATDKEIREDGLFRMIETMFEPFDYTRAAYDRYASGIDPASGPPPVWADGKGPSEEAAAAAATAADGKSKTPSTRPVYMRKASSPGRKVTSNPTSNATTPSGSPPNPLSATATNEAAAGPVPSSSSGGVAAVGRSRSNTARNFSLHNNSNNNSSSGGSAVPTSTPPVPAMPTSYGGGGGFGSQPPRRLLQKGTRKESLGGGSVQVVLDEMGNWSELAKQDTTLPADAKTSSSSAAGGAGGGGGGSGAGGRGGGGGEKPNGMLGFLSRRRGRGHSPKPQERGILGKEGARVIVGS